MVGAFRRATQSFVGASKATSTRDAVQRVAPDERRSASSTSWITASACDHAPPPPSGPGQTSGVLAAPVREPRCPTGRPAAPTGRATLPAPARCEPRAFVAPARGPDACRTICRPASTSRRSRPAHGPSRAWARPSPPSSASPRGAASTSRPWSPTGASSRRLRRLHRGLVPRPRRLRLLPQRRRRVLRRADRRRRRDARPRRPSSSPPAKDVAGYRIQRLEPGPGGQRDHGRGHRADRARRRTPSSSSSARRQGRGDLRQRHDQRARRTS